MSPAGNLCPGFKSRPLPDAIQKEVDEDVKLGVLPEEITVSPDHVDLSMIKAAKQRLDRHGA